jgi:putative peptidoglycan lipid II flippase
VLQLAFQAPFLARLKLLPRFRLDFKDEGMWRIIKLMGPAVFGVSIGQISLLISTIFASYLETGSVSWLFYADRLMEFPTGLLGVALGTILLPSLAKHYQSSNLAEYSRLLDWGLRLTLLLTLPAAVGLAFLSTPLITTLFHYGKFSAHDVIMTRQALIAYSVGLTGLIMVKILAPGFYARQNIRTPVKIGVATLAATQVMNVAFTVFGPLAHAGLALATGLGACFNAGILFLRLRQYQIYRPQAGWRVFFMKLAAALAVMALVLWLGAGTHDNWLHEHGFKRALHLLALIAAGAFAYFATLWLLGFRLKDFAKRGAE